MDTMVEVGTSSDSNIRLVSSSALPFVWNQVVEIMQNNPTGLLDGWSSEDEVLGFVTMGKYDLWVGMDPDEDMKFDCVAFCSLEKYAAFSLYRVVWLGGKAKKHLEDMEKQFSFFASTVHQAHALAMTGRFGWERALGKLGFVPERLEMWRPLGRRH